MTEAGADSAAARRARARTQRSARLGPGAEPKLVDLVVLLPSIDAATILLLCEQAAELAG